MKKYDPYSPVDPKRWLALDDDERIGMVLNYHRRAGDPLPNPRIHAHFHTIVETQVAMGDELPVRATLERLMAEGLDRHDAIHAIGSVLAAHIYDLLQGESVDEETDPNPAYYAALAELTAESWLRQAEEDDDEDDFEEVEDDDDVGDEEDDFDDDDFAEEEEDDDFEEEGDDDDY
jgi:hypothetical protein